MVRCLGITALVLTIIGVIGVVPASPAPPPTSGVVPEPAEAELERIGDLLELATAGKYPGTDRVRPGRYGDRPVWSQRTAVLYFNRRQAGGALMWLTLALGKLGASRKNVISNKKRWMAVWEDAHPAEFAHMKKYLPRTWVDIASFENDANESDLYVYKPVLGFGGEGIAFERGDRLVRRLREQQPAGNWVVQEFINPFLYHGRKTHMRPITLFIIQPDGTREFFIYNKMRVFTAAEDFDEDRLLEGGDNSFMLLSNMHQNKLLFERDPKNAGKRFESTECVLDAETVLSSADSDLSFDKVFSDSKEMHSIIYSIIGDLLECEGTSVSLYDNACFHIMASDVAFDKYGKPYFLEMNTAMAYNGVWTADEQSEFFDGAAVLIKGTASPYKVVDSSMWERL